MEKSNNKWRPIIDLSSLNKYLVVQKFHMETPESIRLAIQPDDWTVSIDLADTYLHVSIHPDYRKYLSFAYQGEVWRFRSLPFGLAPAPWLFTMISQEVKALAQREGLILHQYLDDWVIRSQSRPVLLKQLQWLLGCATAWGSK